MHPGHLVQKPKLVDVVNLIRERMNLGNCNSRLSVGDTIHKCLVVIFLDHVDSIVVSRKQYMSELLGIPEEVIVGISGHETPNTLYYSVFLCLESERIAAKVYEQVNNRPPNHAYEVRKASELLCKVASSKSGSRSMDPESAFHTLYKPEYPPMTAMQMSNPVEYLSRQTPQSVAVHVNSHSSNQMAASSTAGFRQANIVSNTGFGSSRHGPLSASNDVFTSGAVPSTSYQSPQHSLLNNLGPFPSPMQFNQYAPSFSYSTPQPQTSYANNPFMRSMPPTSNPRSLFPSNNGSSYFGGNQYFPGGFM